MDLPAKKRTSLIHSAFSCFPDAFYPHACYLVRWCMLFMVPIKAKFNDWGSILFTPYMLSGHIVLSVLVFCGLMLSTVLLGHIV